MSPPAAQKPSLGRIVHYRASGFGAADGSIGGVTNVEGVAQASNVHAAIITRVFDDDTVGLVVFYGDDRSSKNQRRVVKIDPSAASYDAGWFWPPLV